MEQHIDALITFLDALKTKKPDHKKPDHDDHHCPKKPRCIILCNGYHEIVIETKHEPEQVFLSVFPIQSSVCVGGVDMVGYFLLPYGFVLYADIKSDAAEICYFVR